MKYITKLKLSASHQICDVEDKSTEYTLQFMQDSCKVSLDAVMAYFNLPDKEKDQLRTDINDLVNYFETNYQ